MSLYIDPTTDELAQADPNQRPLWWMARCEGWENHQDSSLGEARQCAWERAVAEAKGEDPSPEPTPDPPLHRDTPASECPTPAACWWHGWNGVLARREQLAQAALQGPVQGPAPDELVPDAECTEPSCGQTCERDRDGTFVREVARRNQDVYVYCGCEHHSATSGWHEAAVEWLRAGR